MRHVSIATLLILLGGCVSTEPAFLATGQPVVRITCGTAIDRINGCIRAAGNICGPLGYVIYDWNGEPWPKPYPDSDALEHDIGRPYDGLLIACGAQGGLYGQAAGK